MRPLKFNPFANDRDMEYTDFGNYWGVPFCSETMGFNNTGNTSYSFSYYPQLYSRQQQQQQQQHPHFQYPTASLYHPAPLHTSSSTQEQQQKLYEELKKKEQQLNEWKAKLDKEEAELNCLEEHIRLGERGCMQNRELEKIKTVQERNLESSTSTMVDLSDDAMNTQSNTFINTASIPRVILNFEKTTLLDLATEYKGNLMIRQNIEQLSKTYPTLIKARGDGNCFYRSIGFLVCKYFQDYKPNLFVETLQDKASVELIGFPKEGFSIKVQEFVNLIKSSPDFCQLLFSNDPTADESLISMMRILTVIGLIENKDDFAAFFGIETEAQLETLIKQAMQHGEEAEEIQIHALCKSLQSMKWNHQIELLIKQISRDSKSIVHYEPYAISSPNANELEGKLQFAVFFRPGHYDILLQEEK